MKLYDMKVKEQDCWGDGKFDAPRGSRTHNGIDLACIPETPVESIICGKVTKLGYPYGDPAKLHLRYVEVTVGAYRYRIFYILPLVKVGDVVGVDTVIGQSQSLDVHYRGITEHVHFEVKNKRGGYLDPTPMLDLLRANAIP